jgi:hypothetical protein
LETNAKVIGREAENFANFRGDTVRVGVYIID